MSPTRREFLRTSAAVALAPSAGFAIDPIKRPGPKADLKLALAAYSFNKALNLAKPTMTLFDFVDFAAENEFPAVELTSYYWAETTDAYIEKLRAHCEKKKMAVSGVPVGNTFTYKDLAKRAAEVKKVKDWTARAAKIGAKTVRIFAGSLEKGETLADAQQRVVDCMNECCETAEKHGILLALENHHGVTDTAENLLRLVKPVKSPALGVNIDTGNFHTADPYADIAKVAPYGVVSQLKTEVFPGNKKEEADLARVIRILKDANFHGYVALEYEAAEDPRIAVPRYGKELRKLIG